MHISVDIDYIVRAGSMMESVDILREHPDTLKVLPHLGNHFMTAVKLGVAAILFYLRKVFPRNFRPLL